MGEAGWGPDAYFEPSGPVGVDGRIEERIRRSRFIACLAPCRDEAGCRGFLNDIHAAHRDATHNCWAYLLGPHPTVEYCSDDGEPSGTAGRPILGAVRRSGMVNVMVVVTRYFGGVKLGVRGLIEAYGLAAERVLTAAERVERRVARPVEVRLPYASIGTVTRLLEEHDAGDTLDWSYGTDACVRASVPLSHSAALFAALDELRARGTLDAWSAHERS